MKQSYLKLVKPLAVANALGLVILSNSALPLKAAPGDAAPEKKAATNSVTVSVKELLKQPSKYADKTVVVEGLVTDVCKNKGCWALLHDTDPDSKGQIRAKQDDDGPTFKAFPLELAGKTILVTGELRETKIDADYLDKWEARVKAARAKSTDKKAGQNFDAVEKQIASLRKRLAESKETSLTSLQFAAVRWETKAAQP